MDGLDQGGQVCQAAAAQRFTEKLLANPNLALWNDSCPHMLPADLKQTDYDLLLYANGQHINGMVHA